MKDVYTFVKNYRTDGGGGSFVLCTSYPVVEYANNTQNFDKPLISIFGRNGKKVNLIIKKNNVNFQDGAHGSTEKLMTGFVTQKEIHKKNAARREIIKAEE